MCSSSPARWRHWERSQCSIASASTARAIRALSGGAISHPAWILGASDAHQAMREPRPYRPALGPDAAAAELRGEVRGGPPRSGRRLVIAPKTVGNHVEHIYAKTDASSRATASLFAMQHGLLPEEQVAAGTLTEPASRQAAR